MEGIRFYLDHATPQDKRKGVHSGNVTAINLETRRLAYPEVHKSNDIVFEGMGAVYYYPNSPVMVTGVTGWWLRECGKRISEAKAREIHPELFRRLDNASGWRFKAESESTDGR